MGVYSKSSWSYWFKEKFLKQYPIPNVLQMFDGRKVTSPEMWWDERRPEILHTFEREIYGISPPSSAKIKFTVLEEDPQAWNGKVHRKQIRIFLLGTDTHPYVDVLIYLPPSSNSSQIPKSIPMFVSLNFQGNQSVNMDPNILINLGSDHKKLAPTRGAQERRWPIDMIIQNGYGVATAYYGDIIPDDNVDFESQLPQYFALKNGRDRSPELGGAVSLWAWGLSRIMDYFELDSCINNKKVAVVGHSRLGKTALWAGALDSRFGIVISNCSGSTGARVARRKLGETIARINAHFPHWFSLNYRKYNDKEQTLPVDQHMLLALIAPRPLYVASADRDLWADPYGEFLSAKYASPVFQLLTGTSFNAPKKPDVESPIKGIIGHHIRHGSHDILAYDWQQYIAFANNHFKT